MEIGRRALFWTIGNWRTLGIIVNPFDRETSFVALPKTVTAPLDSEVVPAKFRTLTDGIIAPERQQAIIGSAATGPARTGAATLYSRPPKLAAISEFRIILTSSRGHVAWRSEYGERSTPPPENWSNR